MPERRPRSRRAKAASFSGIDVQDVIDVDSDSDFDFVAMEVDSHSKDDENQTVDGSEDAHETAYGRTDDPIAALDVKPKVKLESVKRELNELNETNGHRDARTKLANLKDRLQLFYGVEDADLIHAIKLRQKWGGTQFSVQLKQLDQAQVENHGASAPGVISEIVTSGTPQGGSAVIVDGVQLDPGEIRSSETTAILNVGHRILAMDWSEESLLAVACIVDTENPINAPSVLPMIAEKGRADYSPTLVQIYKVNGTKAELYATISGKHGTVTSLQWRPGTSQLALLCGGSVGVVDVQSPGRFSLNLKQFPTIGGKFTTLCWRTINHLSVGNSSGFIAEFDVSQGTSPSFVVHAHDSVVTKLASGWPNADHLIFSTSVDGSSVLINTHDIRVVSKAPRLKFYTSAAAYSSFADSFVSLDDVFTTKLVPWRSPEEPHAAVTLTRHGAGVTSVATSSYHPLLLSGGQDGSVHITNPLRRTMVTRRQRGVHLDCTVWQLECSHKTSEYRFVDVLTAEPLNQINVQSLPIYPSTVAVTSLVWCHRSTWYAAGTASGLIRIENVSV